jgi:bacteriocin biosynthesis cyclodehydratase domain-containing protein
VLERSVLLDHPLLHLHEPLLVTRAATTSASAPKRPALVPWCRLVQDRGRVLIEHAGTLVTFEGAAAGALLPRLLPLLDGTRTAAELARTLGPSAAPAIENALGLLAEHQLLLEGPHADDGPAGLAATYAASVTRVATAPDAEHALESAHVSVLGSGAMADELGRQLAQAGIASVESLPLEAEPETGSFVVAAPEHEELPTLRRLNDRALGCGDPWLQALPYDGRFVVAGPVFVPRVSGCRACFTTRRAASSGYDDDFDLVDRVQRRPPSPATLVTIAAALTTVIAVRWLTAADATLPGRFYALEAGTVVRLRFDRLLRVPRCHACGPHDRAVPSPWFEAAA